VKKFSDKISVHETLQHNSFSKLWGNPKGLAVHVLHQDWCGRESSDGLVLRQNSIGHWNGGSPGRIGHRSRSHAIDHHVRRQDWAQRRSGYPKAGVHFQHTCQGKLARFLIRIWGYEVNSQEEAEESEMETTSRIDDLGLSYEEGMDLVNQTWKRGRRPDLTLECWLPITVKWKPEIPFAMRLRWEN
jgi:hypothetical protein